MHINVRRAAADLLVRSEDDDEFRMAEIWKL
jgi:hypothetical protein